MSISRNSRTGLALSAVAAAVLASIVPMAFADRDDDDRGSHRGISQSGEQKDMRRVGHSDLQGRPPYHPTFIRYGRVRIQGRHRRGVRGGSRQRNADHRARPERRLAERVRAGARGAAGEARSSR